MSLDVFDDDFMVSDDSIMSYNDLPQIPDQYQYLNFLYGLMTDTRRCCRAEPLLPHKELALCLHNLKQTLLKEEQVIVPGPNHSFNTGDVQGIYWDSKTQRETMLEERLKRYETFTNIPGCISKASSDVNFEYTPSSRKVWQFDKFYRKPTPKLPHFQLRNQLIHIPQSNRCKVIYSELSFSAGHSAYPVLKQLDLQTGEIDPLVEFKHDPSMRITCVDSAKENLLLIGTLHGSLYIKSCDGSLHDTSIGDSFGSINCIRMDNNSNQAQICTNNGQLTTIDLNNCQKLQTTRFPWPINYMTNCPYEPNVQLFVGDNVNGYLLDKRQGLVPIDSLRGHKDFNFACDWSTIDCNLIATGSQDCTVRVWDRRWLDRDVVCTQTSSGVRTVEFNRLASTQQLSWSESIDRVCVASLNEPEWTIEEVTFLGQTMGAHFVNVDDHGEQWLVCGISDGTTGGILRMKAYSPTSFMSYDYI